MQRALAAALTLRARVLDAIDLVASPVHPSVLLPANRVHDAARDAVALLDVQIAAIEAWLAGYEHAQGERRCGRCDHPQRDHRSEQPCCACSAFVHCAD
jgi:hypothetical protein